MNRVDVLVLGAGPAGLGAGVAAARSGVDSLVLEAESEVGGLCRSTTVHGCDFDLGPKVLVLDDSPVRDELLGFLDGNHEHLPMVQQTYLRDVGLVGFPVQRHLVDLPHAEREHVLADMAEQWADTRPPRDYRDWLVRHFGRRLCETVLFPYEEKKWQVPLADFAHEWALSRPTAVAHDEVLAGARTRLAPKGGYHYPRHGTIATLSRAIARHAGPIRLDHRVTAIDPATRTVVAGGEAFRYRRLVSTLPLDLALRLIRGPRPVDADRVLRWLPVRVFNLVFHGDAPLPGTAIHFPEPEFRFRRVCVLPNLCPALARPGLTPVSVELSLPPDGPAPAPEGQLDDVLSDLRRVEPLAGLGPLVGHGVLTLDRAYPLQHRDLRALVDDVHAAHAEFGIHHCGRGGTFRYCNADSAYAQGVAAVARATASTDARS